MVNPLLLQFFDETMRSFGCSAHDVSHCYRVANLASEIAREEMGASPEVAFTAGLLHDMLDSKLNKRPKETEEKLRELFKGDYSDDACDVILTVIKSVGFKNLLKGEHGERSFPVEYSCVQDADLLDAMGAIGVCRCFSYGGKTSNPLFGVTADNTALTHEQYLSQQSATADERSSSTQHFFDKLLLLKSKLTTKRGRELAGERHDFMIQFLTQLSRELRVAGDTNADVFADKIKSYS